MTPIEIALKEYANDSWDGIKTNPEVLKYFTEIGYDYIDEDETPWCAAFLNWVLRKCNIQTPNKLNARSFLEMGIITSQPVVGDLVILWRINPAGPYGHCGLFIKETETLVWILGGNQNSRVCIQAYSKNQLLGYRSIQNKKEEVV